jgi:hypothetical protein
MLKNLLDKIHVRTAVLELLGSLAKAATTVKDAIVEYYAELDEPVPTDPPELPSDPGPTPTPTPVPVPTPTEPEPEHFAARGETLYMLIVPPVGQKLSVTLGLLQATYKIWRPRQITTSQPSFKGATVGQYPDPLEPIAPGSSSTGEGYLVELRVSRAAMPGICPVNIAGETSHVRVWKFALEDLEPFPFYAEVQFAQLARGYGLADEGSTLAMRAQIARDTFDLCRSYGVEPMKQNTSVYPRLIQDGSALDLDSFASFGASFKQLVLDGRQAPPCIFGPAPTVAPSVLLLQAIERAIQSGVLPKDSWCYAWDEGEGDAAATAQALARVKLIKQYAPSLGVTITRRPSSEFAPYVDHFVPVLDLATAGTLRAGTDGAYTSCMAQGSCSAPGGTPTGTPMMNVESGGIHQIAYAPVISELGGVFGLYYCFTQRFPTAWQPGGIFFAGGNGDGTALYPSQITDQKTPWPSLRMLCLHRGIQIARYFRTAREMALPEQSQIQSVVSGPRNWSKDVADYERVVRAIAASIEGQIP